MPFPATGIKVELMFGGAWTNVTPDVDWSTGYTVRLGRTSNTGLPQPSFCTILLRNPKGKYTPGVQVKTDNTPADFYPNVPATQMRCSTSAGIDFVGDVNGWSPAYVNGKAGYVSVSGIDIMDRLTRFPLPAALEFEVLADAPYAYWPMTDDGSTGYADNEAAGAQSSNPLKVGNAATAKLSFGAGGIPSGEGTAVAFAPSSATAGQVLVSHQMSLPGNSFTYELCFNAGTALPSWVIGAVVETIADFTPGQLYIDSSGDLNYKDGLITIATGVNVVDGNWHHLAVTVFTGSGTSIAVFLDGVSVGTGTSVFSSAPIFTPYIGDVNPADGASQHFQGSVGQVAVYSSILSGPRILAHAQAAQGWQGETCDARIKRFLGYAGLTAGGWDIDASTTVLASYPQVGKNVVDGCQDTAVSEGGAAVFYIRGGLATFRNRDYRIPAAPTLTIDAVKDSDAATYTPTIDRTGLGNDATVTQSTATGTTSTQNAVNAASKATYGSYPIGMTSYVQDGNEALYEAQWLAAYNGTLGIRIPQRAVDLLTAATNLWAAVQATQIGSRIREQNLPIAAGPSTIRDNYVEGWTKTVSMGTQMVVYDLSTADNPPEMVVEDPDYGVIWDDGFTIHANQTATSTTFGVDSASGELITTTAGDYPLKLQIGAEVISCPNPPTGTSPQTFTGVSRHQNGTTAAPLTAGEEVDVYMWATATI